MKKSRSLRIYSIVIIGVFLILASGCKKDIEIDPYGNIELHYPPIVTTVTVNNIAQTTAISGGDIESIGSNVITEQGICWGEYSAIPPPSCTYIADSSGTINFRITMTGLKPNTEYIVQAYATNSYGTGYGSWMSFTTN